MSIDWKRFSHVIDQHQRFVLTSHVRPDCDALGSELGMAGILESLGKQVRIVNGMAAPPMYTFIDPEQKLRTLGVDIQAGELGDADAFMVLDTSAWVQLGPMADVLRASTAYKMVLDHHVSEDDLGAELFKNPEASATGVLVAQAAEALGVKLTPEIATPLYAAAATDTGWFRFSSAGPITYRVAAALVEAGASPAAIYRDLYEQDTLARIQLRGRILARTQTELSGRLAYTAALSEDFRQTGALASDTEDVINALLTIRGVEVAVIFLEQEEGSFKLSFRSRSAVDCSQLAQLFAGGGHKAAAGASVPGPFEVARPRVLDAVRAAMR